jgi:hypothetical protein
MAPFIKRVGPDGKMHEGWCAIFEKGRCCSCKDDRRGGRRIIRRDGGGSALKQKAGKLENA